MPQSSQAKQPFDKVGLDLESQISRLRGRGLVCEISDLSRVLQRMSYYRFSGYAWWFYKEDEWGKFKPDTNLADVLRLYEFDHGLRSSVLGFSHTVEVWLRASMTNHLAHAYGPMGYLDPVNFHNAAAHQKDLAKLSDLIEQDKTELFMRAFRAKYTDKFPPIWMATELMTLGLLSKWFDNMKSDRIRKLIAQEVALPTPAILASFLRQLTNFRNGAAHHSRIWNRQTPTGLKHIRKPPAELRTALADATLEKIYPVLALCAYTTAQIDPATATIDDLRTLLLSADEDWLEEMEVPYGFEGEELWN